MGRPRTGCGGRHLSMVYALQGTKGLVMHSLLFQKNNRKKLDLQSVTKNFQN